ncbi:hypothetical protein BCR44DRAFT_57299 [Catenaria anguillulae PL171]|uniref:Uncharacterized protein n=1 Tax=Catenaria anguillulae PL171 TaxID=765915 RepID=A0A1Y2HJ83_9FUNG|nr:hypothetical protein BCR44DRAFT_57299 [Catenaria anguillulae PL171]
MAQWKSEANATTLPALGAFSAPRAASLGPADVIDVGLLAAGRYHHHGRSLATSTSTHVLPTSSQLDKAKRGTWTFAGNVLGLHRPARQRHGEDNGELPMALGPPRNHMLLSPPTTCYIPPATHVLTQRDSYPKKIASLRALHPDLGPISTSLLTDIAHDDAVQCTSPSFVLDGQGNCLALVQSNVESHITFAFTALNNALSVSAIDTSCTPPQSSSTLSLATLLGASLLEISVSPLRHTLTADQTDALPAEHTLVSVRSEYRVNIYRIVVSHASAFTTSASSSTQPFAAAQLLDSIDLSHRCTRICASPFSATEVLMSTAAGMYLWRDSPSSSSKRLKLILSELDVLRFIDPVLAKQRQEELAKSTVERVKPRRSRRRSQSSSSLPLPPNPDSDPSADPERTDPAPASHVTCLWSPSPRFIFVHTPTTVYRLDLRAPQPSATIEPVWTVPTTSQALAPGTPLPTPVSIQHMACDARSDTLIIASGPQLVLIDAREPVRVGVLGVLGCTMSRELGVHLLDPVSIAGDTLVLASASILHHTTHLLPIRIDPANGGGALLARRSVCQPMLPRELPKVKQATPANEWLVGLRTVERIKHVEFPQDAPLVGCAMVPVREGQALVVVQAFADGCVLSREVPVVTGVGAVKGNRPEDAVEVAEVTEQLAGLHLVPDRDEWMNPPAPIAFKFHGRKFLADPDEKLRSLIAQAAKGELFGEVSESSVLSASEFGDDGLARLKTLVGFTPDDDWDLAQVFPRDQKRADLRRIAAIAHCIRKACQPPPIVEDGNADVPGHVQLLKSSILQASFKGKSKLESIEWTSGTQALAGKWTEMVGAASTTFGPPQPPPPPPSASQVAATSTQRSRASAPLFSLGSKITKRGPPALSSSQQQHQPFPPYASQPTRPAPSSSQVPGFASASQQPHASRVSAPLGFFSQPPPLPPPPSLSQHHSHHHQQSHVVDSSSWTQHAPPPQSQPLTGRRSMALSFDFGFGSTSALSSSQAPPPPPPPPSQLMPMSSSQPDPYAWPPASASQLPPSTLSQLGPPAPSQASTGPMPSMSQPAHVSRPSQGMDFGFGGMSLSQPAGQPPRKRKRTQGF